MQLSGSRPRKVSITSLYCKSLYKKKFSLSISVLLDETLWQIMFSGHQMYNTLQDVNIPTLFRHIKVSIFWIDPSTVRRFMNVRALILWKVLNNSHLHKDYILKFKHNPSSPFQCWRSNSKRQNVKRVIWYFFNYPKLRVTWILKIYIVFGVKFEIKPIVMKFSSKKWMNIGFYQ